MCGSSAVQGVRTLGGFRRSPAGLCVRTCSCLKNFIRCFASNDRNGLCAWARAQHRSKLQQRRVVEGRPADVTWPATGQTTTGRCVQRAKSSSCGFSVSGVRARTSVRALVAWAKHRGIVKNRRLSLNFAGVDGAHRLASCCRSAFVEYAKSSA